MLGHSSILSPTCVGGLGARTPSSGCPSQGGCPIQLTPRQHQEKPEIYLLVCLLGQEEGWGRLSSAPHQGCVLAPGQGPWGLFWSMKQVSVSPCFRSPHVHRGKG